MTFLYMLPKPRLGPLLKTVQYGVVYDVIFFS